MIKKNTIEEEGKEYTAVRVELPKTNLLMVSNDFEYIMCAALDIDLLSNMLAVRKVIDGSAFVVRSIYDLLHAPLEKITDASKEYGWEIGMTGKDALLNLS